MLSFHAIALDLLDKIQGSIAQTPARVGVVPGEIAWDDCECDGGMLVASVGRLFLSSAWPTVYGQVPETLTPCEAPILGADITIQAIRCAPQPEGNDVAPDPAALTAVAAQVTDDATSIIKAVSCRLTELEDSYQIARQTVGEVLIRGPQGACVGSELAVQVGVLRGVT